MSRELETLAARLFSVGFAGQTCSDELQKLLDRGVLGVIFFSRNVGLAEEVAELTSDIKRLARRPVILALDQEGGQVARLRRGFTEIPAMRVLGATRDAALARAVGALIGRELRAVGFDMNYAPVLDIDTNPDNPVIAARSFGSDPERVTEFGIALARGLMSEGVAACGKHFPGHGDTSQDSHVALPRSTHGLERLTQVELKPFAAAIQAGIPSLMTAHVVFESLDPRYPATLSAKWIDGVLRRQWGYDGLVVSDDIEMSAIADHFGIEDAVTLGLNAGIDHFLCCRSAELAQRAIDAVVHAVESGRVSEQRLRQANQRLGRFAARFAQPATEAPDLGSLRCAEHLALIDRVRMTAVHASETPSRDPTQID